MRCFSVLPFCPLLLLRDYVAARELLCAVLKTNKQHTEAERSSWRDTMRWQTQTSGQDLVWCPAAAAARENAFILYVQVCCCCSEYLDYHHRTGHSSLGAEFGLTAVMRCSLLYLPLLLSCWPGGILISVGSRHYVLRCKLGCADFHR